MTMNDLLVVGGGTLTLLCLFLFVGAIMRGGVHDVWGVVRRYVAVKVADRQDVLELVRAQDRTGSTAGSPGSRDLVPGHTHQIEPQEPDDSEPDEKSFARQLAREELIITLAVQRKDDGEYLWSANEITKFVGGTAAPVKATIANVRGKKEAPPVGAPLRRPVNGW